MRREHHRTLQAIYSHPELDLFRGEILGLNGGADFYGKNPKQLRAEFKKSLEVFRRCAERRGLNLVAVSQEGSISGFRQNFMRGWLS